MIEYRDESTTCACCGGRIPAGKIRWTRTGHCPGHINPDGNLCGAIEEMLPPSKKWKAEQAQRKVRVIKR